jgi:L-threonylcarbamoyladenylate synthase
MPSFIHYKKIAHLLHAGGVIAYPTEGVFGLGCVPDDNEAVIRILDIKGRSAEAGLILISPDYELLARWLAPTETELKRLQARQTHPVTWVVTANPATPNWLTGGRPTLAVRITDHPVVADICNAAGTALVSTSANRSGRPAARSVLAARKMLRTQVDYLVPGSLGQAAGPSEIRVAQSDRILRHRSARRPPYSVK